MIDISAWIYCIEIYPLLQATGINISVLQLNLTNRQIHAIDLPLPQIIRFIKAIRCSIADSVVGALVAMSKPCMVPLVSFRVTSMSALRRSSA